jgi:hypothetical protein
MNTDLTNGGKCVLCQDVGIVREGTYDPSRLLCMCPDHLAERIDFEEITLETGLWGGR